MQEKYFEKENGYEDDKKMDRLPDGSRNDAFADRLRSKRRSSGSQ